MRTARPFWGAVPVIFALSALLAAASPALALDVYHESSWYPVDANFVVDCANGGAGEPVRLTGTTHVNLHAIDDPGVGTLLFVVEVNTHLDGVGETTGDVFVGASDSGHYVVQHFGPGTTFTNARFARLIGLGRAPNLLFHQVDHVTVDPNGTVRSETDIDRISCR